jgi:Transposase IS116/IS110/IS902 family
MKVFVVERYGEDGLRAADVPEPEVGDGEVLVKVSAASVNPLLREALASRLTIEPHGVMVAQLLAHIDTLDAALQNLSERIEVALAPHAHIVELLCTIPGVQAHAAQVLIAECGLDMTVFPTAGHFASWAGACRPPRISRPQTLRADPPRARLADLPTHRLRPRRRPHQRHLPRLALRPSCAADAANQKP